MKRTWDEEGVAYGDSRYVIPVTIELTKDMVGIYVLETGTAMMRHRLQ